MKTDHQTNTIEGAAAFEKYHNSYDETKLSKHDFYDESEHDFDAENDCPVCDNQGSYEKCNNCSNGSNFKFEE